MSKTDDAIYQGFERNEKLYKSRIMQLEAEVAHLRIENEEIKERDIELLSDAERINTKINITEAINDTLRAKYLQFARLIVIAEMDGDPNFDTYGVCIEAGLKDEFLEGRSFKEIILERAKTAIAEIVGAENAPQK